MCGDLADAPEQVLGSILIDEVADQGEDDQHDDCSATSNVLDGEVLLAPFLANFLESQEDDDSAEPNSTGRTIPFRKPSQNVAYHLEYTGGNVFKADEAADLSKANDEGCCGDETGQHGHGDVVQEKAKTEDAHCQGVNPDHEGNGVGYSSDIVFALKTDNDLGSEQAKDGSRTSRQISVYAVGNDNNRGGSFTK